MGSSNQWSLLYKLPSMASFILSPKISHTTYPTEADCLQHNFRHNVQYADISGPSFCCNHSIIPQFRKKPVDTRHPCKMPIAPYQLEWYNASIEKSNQYRSWIGPCRLQGISTPASTIQSGCILHSHLSGFWWYLYCHLVVQRGSKSRIGLVRVSFC